LNPVLPALLARSANRIVDRADKTTTDAEIVQRDWLLVDVDRIRPGGISSTDEELACAHEVLSKAVAFLRKQGWPEPITAMSGNGYYALCSGLLRDRRQHSEVGSRRGRDPLPG
jgi:hypothetical protein